MQQKHTWFGEQAFGENAANPPRLDFQSQRNAMDYVRQSIAGSSGIALLQGPKGSGKHTIVERFAGTLPSATACAIVDGARTRPEELLSSALAEFGYVTELTSVDELLKMVNVFTTQQLRTCQAPILIVENIDQMYPASLRVLTILATFIAGGMFAVRMILTSQRDLSTMLEAQSMSNIAKRASDAHHIQPLTANESMKYLYLRLAACGVREPDSVFPVDVCDRLHQQAQGWPAHLDNCAMEAIERASSFPLSVADTFEVARDDDEPNEVPAAPLPEVTNRISPPRLRITRDGKPQGDFTFNSNKILIGRSKFADINIDDNFASKAHALMLLYSDALVLLDLNSTNGTLVNSVKSGTTVLRSNDIISLGHYRIKVENAPAGNAEMLQGADMAETTEMKNLRTVRDQRLKQVRLSSDATRKKA